MVRIRCSPYVVRGLPFALCFALLSTGPARAGVTEMQSVDPGGAPGNGASTLSAISADGRFVAFSSRASNLVAGDDNGVEDVFVRDRILGTTQRVSVDSAGAQANGRSVTPVISGDGEVVAFVSAASNLVADDTNGRLDVFVHDRVSGTTERVSVDSAGLQASSDSLSPWLSYDGSRVVFSSLAGNLTADDTNGTFDVFLHDRPTAVTTRVSVDSAGREANGASLAPRISADGLVVVFQSSASNLVPGDTNFVNDVFAHDVATGEIERVSVDSSGMPGNFQSLAGSPSADGRFVAFDSDATNLVAGDSNFQTDVFVHDRLTGVTSRVSVASDGTEANARSGFVDPPAVSADGRFVAFASDATNLVAGDANNVSDVFLHDRLSGETTRVDVASDGTEANGPVAQWPCLSADGSTVVFASSATNLVPGDDNGVQDVFAHTSGCGNGVLDDGEQCDDGNTDDGDCCTSSCTFAPLGSPCEDGDACTGDDFCSEGTCEPGELDADLCIVAMRCYKAYPEGRVPGLKPGPTHLSDPFQDGDVNVRGPRGLCAAADLGSESDLAVESAPRLACHHLRTQRDGLESLAGREVTVSNRFGLQTMAVYRPERLCIASGLTAPPEPGSYDHYACYGARSVAGKGSFRSDDERQRDAYGSFESRVGQTVDVCVAASVNEMPTVHPAAHLVCYRAHDRRHQTSADVFQRRGQTVHHLFGSEDLQLVRAREVCVPSEIRFDGSSPTE